MPSRSVVQIACTLLLLTGLSACVAPSSPAADGDQGHEGSADTVLRSPVSTAVQFAPSPELAPPGGEATLLLLGFRDEDLDPRGMPSAVARPSFEWKQPKRKVTWPVEHLISLPQDPSLRFFAVIDVDGRGRLSPGDHLSAAQPLAQEADAPLVLRIDRSLTVNTNEHSTEPSSEGSPPATDEVPGTPGADPSGARVSLDCSPRLPFLSRASVLLAGFPPTDGAQGHPEDGKPPSYLWQSAPLALDWPVQLDLPTPSGLSLFIVLDVDGDGRPSKGDLATDPVDLTAPDAGQAAQEFTLDQVWWPAQRAEAGQ